MNSIPVEPSELRERAKSEKKILIRNQRLLLTSGFLPDQAGWTPVCNGTGKIPIRGWRRLFIASHYALPGTPVSRIDIKKHVFITHADVFTILANQCYSIGFKSAQEQMRRAAGIYS